MKATHSTRCLMAAAAVLFLVTAVILNATPVTAAGSRPGGSLEDLRVRIPPVEWGVDASAPSQSGADQPGPLLAQSDVDFEQPADVYDFEKKSPRRAFLQSFLIPGWGQYYVRSGWWKPVLFLGIEAASWYGVAHFHSTGLDKENEYQAFADEHWIDTLYLMGLKDVYYENKEEAWLYDEALGWNWHLDTILYDTVRQAGNPPVFESARWSHHAFFHVDGSEVDKDEFYENIGKYHQFTFGWDDYRETVPKFPEDYKDTNKSFVSPNRSTYLHMRDDANKEFKRASTMIVFAIANHLVSGVEAALGARRYNRSRDQFGTIETKLRWVRSPTTGQPMPHVTLGYRF